MNRRQLRTTANRPNAVKLYLVVHYGYEEYTGINEIKVMASSDEQALWKFHKGYWKDSPRPEEGFPYEIPEFCFFNEFRQNIHIIDICDIAPEPKVEVPATTLVAKGPQDGELCQNYGYHIPQLHGR